MFLRYDVRNACHKMKRGVNVSDKPEIQEVEKTRNGRSWQDFGKTWDVVVKPNKVTCVEQITDMSLVSETCAKKNLTVELNADREWSPAEEAIIQLVEAQFLEGIMSWANYKQKWSVRWNFDLNRAETFLINRPAVQTEVTQEMIDAKLRESMQQAKSVEVLEVRPMTEEEKALYTKMVAEGKI